MCSAFNRMSSAGRARVFSAPGALLVVGVAAVLTGCAKRDSIVVGSVPDDYRTNHPIVVSEKDEILDLPVGVSDRRMTQVHRVAVAGYIAHYDHRAAAPVSIMVPAGAANSAAASAVAHDIASYLYAKGVPSGRVVTVPYSSGAPDIAAPLRIIYPRMRASTDQCGRWPDDLLKNSENKHYSNFGCAYQNNLAAQIANPADLLGPREPGEIDAENRGNALEQYKQRQIAPEFITTSEVNY